MSIKNDFKSVACGKNLLIVLKNQLITFIIESNLKYIGKKIIIFFILPNVETLTHQKTVINTLDCDKDRLRKFIRLLINEIIKSKYNWFFLSLM